MFTCAPRTHDERRWQGRYRSPITGVRAISTDLRQHFAVAVGLRFVAGGELCLPGNRMRAAGRCGLWMADVPLALDRRFACELFVDEGDERRGRDRLHDIVGASAARLGLEHLIGKPGDDDRGNRTRAQKQ